MEGVGNSNKNILVLGATNLPWKLDSAFIRRFTKKIYIPLPPAYARKQMFVKSMKCLEHDLEPQDFDNLVALTDNFSASDISNVIKSTATSRVGKLTDATHFKRVMVNETEEKFMPCSPGDEKAEEMDYTQVSFCKNIYIDS